MDSIPKIPLLDREWYDIQSLRDIPLGKRWFKSRNISRFNFVHTKGLIQGEDFIYTAFSDATQVKQEQDSKSDRVLLSCAWVEAQMNNEHLRRAMSDDVEQSSRAKRARIDELYPDFLDEESLVADDEALASFPTEEICPDSMMQLLPGKPMPERVTRSMLPTIELSEDDLFLGGTQRAMAVIICGVRHPDYIYFRGSDVAKYLKRRLALQERKFINPIHYIHVYEGSQLVHYFRFMGLIRYLFTLRLPILDSFHSWASRTLFLIQFRPTYSSDLLRIPQSLCQPFLRTSVGGFSGVFVCWLQSAETLRRTFEQLVPFNQPTDNRSVYRIGLTSNLLRDLAQLRNEYILHSDGLISELHVVAFETIDPDQFHAVESELAEIIKRFDDTPGVHIFRPFDGANELVVFDELFLNRLKAELHRLHVSNGRGIAQHAREQIIQELTSNHRREIEERTTKFQNEMIVMQMQYERRIHELNRKLTAHGIEF